MSHLPDSDTVAPSAVSERGQRGGKIPSAQGRLPLRFALDPAYEYALTQPAPWMPGGCDIHLPIIVGGYMPAKSKAQQQAAGAALSAKRGDTPKSELKGASREMYDSMTESELEELASTERKGKPEHAS